MCSDTFSMFVRGFQQLCQGHRLSCPEPRVEVLQELCTVRPGHMSDHTVCDDLQRPTSLSSANIGKGYELPIGPWQGYRRTLNRPRTEKPEPTRHQGTRKKNRTRARAEKKVWLSMLWQRKQKARLGVQSLMVEAQAPPGASCDSEKTGLRGKSSKAQRGPVAESLGGKKVKEGEPQWALEEPLDPARHIQSPVKLQLWQVLRARHSGHGASLAWQRARRWY